MQNRNLIEAVLILVIAFLFCFPLFLVYSTQQEKINTIENDLLEIKKELYTIRLYLLNWI